MTDHLWETVAIAVAVLAGIAWMGAFWRSRNYLRLAFAMRSTRTITMLLMVLVIIAASFVRPLAGADAAAALEITWAIVRGVTFIVGVSYWIAGPPAGVPPL